MEITLRELNSVKTCLLSDLDINKVEGVRATRTDHWSRNRKDIKVYIGLVNYLFSSELKLALVRKIKEDLGNHYNIKFGV
jgi:hypothetical protein